MSKLDYVGSNDRAASIKARILNQAEKAHFSVWHWAQMAHVLTQDINDRSRKRSSHDIDACRDIQHFCMGMENLAGDPIRPCIREPNTWHVLGRFRPQGKEMIMFNSASVA